MKILTIIGAGPLKEILNVENGSRFKRNFIKVARANIFAQLIPLAAAPFLTRIFSPSDFGTTLLFSSTLSLLLSFSTWRFDWSVPNANNRVQASGLLLLGLMVLFLVSALLFLLFLLFEPPFQFWKGSEVLKPFLLFFPIALLGSGIRQLMQSWFVREADLTAVSRACVVQGIAGTSVAAAAGVAKLGAFGLIGSTVVSAWAGIVMLIRCATGLRESLKSLSWDLLQEECSQFWRESTLSTFIAILNTASLSIIPLLLAQHYTASEVGWYALMHRCAIVPMGLFTIAIGQSFWSEAAKLVQRDRPLLKSLYVRSTKNLAFAVLPAVLICLAGPLFVGTVFGKTQWEQAGYILAALAPLVFGQVVISPLSHLVVHRKQHWQFVWDACRMVLLVSVVTVCAKFHLTIVQTVLCTSLMMFMMYVILFRINMVCLRGEL